jgi:OOP family OmpA-OmpF porin
LLSRAVFVQYPRVKRPNCARAPARGSSVFLAVAIASAALSSAPVEAQSKKDFSTVRFYPAAGPGNFITVEGAHVGGHLAPSFGLFFDYAADTLKLERPCDGIPNAVRCENRETAFVAGTGMAHIMGSFAIADRTQLSLDIPVGFTDTHNFFTQVRVSDSSSPSLEIAPQQGFAFADARVAAKTRILGRAEDSFGLAATAFTSLPTGMITSHGDCRAPGSCSFTGERGVNVGANLVAELRAANFRSAANLGAAYRPHRRFLTAETGTELLYGVAGQYDITPLVHAKAEVTGAVSLIGADDYPIEARGSLSYGRDVIILAGGGGGLYGVVGNPSFRVFAGLQWTPMHRDLDQDGIEDDDDACPSEVEDRDGHSDQDGCPDLDNDRDGIPDKSDACKNDPEDVDQFADEDGCPELDNDEDGVPDGYDSCEGAKEDRDGDHDDDGCPDLDTDRDGVRDDLDLCPNDAEDTDGLADDDGCPEPDFDNDGLNDIEDGCPDQMELWNGVMDEDGCPEDDTDADGVPDQVDACTEQAETLNAVKDADGCPDTPALITLRGRTLIPTMEPNFEGDKPVGEQPLINALADFIKRSHRRGEVRVVLVASADSPTAAARVAAFAKTLERRIKRPVSSAHVPGSPLHLEIELSAPGAKPPTAPKPTAPEKPAPDAGAPAP